MNILPKKSWHVRTKKNIARVRKDEAKAAEEVKETQRRIALAAQEARTALLRERASKRLQEEAGSSITSISANQNDDGDGEGQSQAQDLRFGLPLASLRDVVQADGHVNFFQDEEGGKRQTDSVNTEHEEEKRKEQEDYEKKIGYLVYLGQDSLDLSRSQPWYSKVARGKPEEIDQEKAKERDLDHAASVIGGLEEKSKTASVEEIKMTKVKSFLDPLKDIRKYLSTPGVKRKLDSLPSSSSKSSYSKPLSPPRKRKRENEDESELKKSKHHKKHKHKNSKKSKKHKKHSSRKERKHKRKSSSKPDSSDSDVSMSGSSEDSEEEKKRSKLEKLRAERLQREREERRKAEQVLAKMRGESTEEQPKPKDSLQGIIPPTARVKQKYNAQFNPHLARQNYEYE